MNTNKTSKAQLKASKNWKLKNKNNNINLQINLHKKDFDLNKRFRSINANSLPDKLRVLLDSYDKHQD